MLEMKYILENMDNESLILIDELCRSTNFNEGLAVSMSLCEYMLAKVEDNYYKHGQKTFVFYASHYADISCLEYLYKKVTGVCLESTLEKNDSRILRLNHSYKVNRGFCSQENYGK